MNESLFKFYADSINTITNLSLGQLYMASPLQFNDPYDLPEIFLSSHASCDNIDELLQGFMLKEYTLSAKQELILSEILNYSRNETDSLRKANNTGIFIDKLLKCSLRVCSLSYLKKGKEDYEFPGGSNGIPMFAYYGDSHKGLVIEYNSTLINSSLSARDMLLQVEYNKINGNDRKSIPEHTFPANVNATELKSMTEMLRSDTLQLDQSHRELIKKTIGHKKSCWEHEQEYRLISISKQRFIIKNKKDSIKAIYFGVRMAPDRKKFYRDLIRYSEFESVKFYCCYLRYNSISNEDVIYIEECSNDKLCEYCQLLTKGDIWVLPLD